MTDKVEKLTHDEGEWSKLSAFIAEHDGYHVNADGWTVCLCGYVAEGDDDDGSHALHLADVLSVQLAPLLAKLRAVEELLARAYPVIGARVDGTTMVVRADDLRQIVNVKGK